MRVSQISESHSIAATAGVDDLSLDAVLNGESQQSEASTMPFTALDSAIEESDVTYS